MFGSVIAPIFLKELRDVTLVRFRERGYRLYRRGELTLNAVNQILDLVDRAKKVKNPIGISLGGRTELIEGTIDDVGPVVVKSYHRGGLLRHLFGSIHTRMFQTRCRLESNTLAAVQAFGGKVPKPVAYVEEGEFFYFAWLVTEKIEGSKTLIQYISEHPEQAKEKLEMLSEQIRILIRKKVHHIDLHPGNAVVDNQGAVWLVDFDRAYQYEGSQNRLRDLYLRRWRRAVIKHRLPEVMNEVVSLALRENFEDA